MLRVFQQIFLMWIDRTAIKAGKAGPVSGGSIVVFASFLSSDANGFASPGRIYYKSLGKRLWIKTSRLKPRINLIDPGAGTETIKFRNI